MNATEDPDVFMREGRTVNGSGGSGGALPPEIDLARYDTEPIPDQEWSVHNRFPLEDVSTLGGEGGTGKSIILMQLAVAQPIGGDWLHSVPERGPVMLVNCEDIERVLIRRLRPMLDHYEVTYSEVAKAGLHVWSLAGKEAVMARFDNEDRIVTTPVFQDLVARAKDVRPKTIILDNQADVFGGDEIKRLHVRQFITLLRGLAMETGSAVVMSFHPSLSGLTNKSGLSGSLHWHNGPRGRAWFRTATTADGDEPDPDLRELKFMKNQYGPLADTVMLRWRNGLFVPDGRPGSLDRMAASKRAEEVFLALLKIFNGQGQNASVNRGPTFAPALFAKHPERNGVNKQAFEAAMQRLLGKGEIRIETFGAPSKQRTRLQIASNSEQPRRIDPHD